MESSIVGDNPSSNTSLPIKRGRGRPKKIQNTDQEPKIKRGRGRPRKHPAPIVDNSIKRARGRPRKYAVVEKEQGFDGQLRPVMKKVESGHLLKHMMNYFTKLMIIHAQLAKEGGTKEPLFEKLKGLDFQMAEMCKKILANEYMLADGDDTLAA